MRRKLTLALMVLVLPIGLLSLDRAAFADTINLTLATPLVDTNMGTTLSFFATVSAPGSNSGTEFLNGDSFNVGAPLILDDTGFVFGFPLSLQPGSSFTGLLFIVTVPSNAPYKTYQGSFSIIGGSSDTASSVLASAPFEIDVVPEPSTLFLLGTGLSGLVGVVRLRQQHWARSRRCQASG